MSSSGVIWCWNVDPYLLSTWRQLQIRREYSLVNSLRHPHLGHKHSHWMPGFQTKSLSVTIIRGNDLRIIPRNFMVCLTHVFHEGWFWAIWAKNGLSMLFYTRGGLRVRQNESHGLILNAKHLYNNAVGYGFPKNIFE